MKTKNNHKKLLSPKNSHSRQPRRLHKKLLLHPLAIFLILCVGVLLVKATFQTHADSYEVTATVPAPLPTSPAVITSYSDQEHVSSSRVTISGTCPDQSYVKLHINNAFNGVSLCSSGAFTIRTSLVPGANSLQAKVYNITDNEGPASSATTIYYDELTSSVKEPTQPHPETVINSLDGSPYKKDAIQQTSNRPTVTGFAPPYSLVTLTFHSDPTQCTTRADANGWWTCTLTPELAAGGHYVDIVITTPDGRTISSPRLYILVTTYLDTLLVPKLPASQLIVSSDYRYQVRYPGELWSWNMQITGGTLPYSIDITWGDGKTTHKSNVQAAYQATHTFLSSGTYQPIIRVTDGAGQSATIQTLAISKTSTVDFSHNTSSSDFQSYLWIIWPAYIIILLMIASFWLGEYEILSRRRSTRKHKAVHR
ncbi:MAG: hypothetical protein JWP06_964 [Candidatus Saccharibacteria bacterium]|nr:hypothetical protein [Candidatus Saccharibacteria bacterium]